MYCFPEAHWVFLKYHFELFIRQAIDLLSSGVSYCKIMVFLGGAMFPLVFMFLSLVLLPSHLKQSPLLVSNDSWGDLQMRLRQPLMGRLPPSYRVHKVLGKIRVPAMISEPQLMNSQHLSAPPTPLMKNNSVLDGVRKTASLVVLLTCPHLPSWEKLVPLALGWAALGDRECR